VVSSAIARPFVSGWLLMGGTSVVGTLLGPEGSGGNQGPLAHVVCCTVWVGGWLWVLVFSGRGCPCGIPLLLRVSGVGVGVAVWGWWAWLLFENCIVDASIFYLNCVFVVKLVRAYGGCLGIRSR
jgi:hypothetical protein